MRAFKTLLAGAILLTFASFVDAQTVVRITGSTAFRSATNQAIRDIFDASPAMIYGYVGGSNDNANISIFKGNVGGESVIIKTSFTGAVDGHAAVVSGNTSAVFYLEDGNPLLVGGVAATLTSAGTSNLDNNASAGQTSDVAMLDHFPSTTPFKPPGFPSMTVTPVGVIAFKWFASRGYSSLSMNVDTTSGSNVVSVADTTGLVPGMTISGNVNIPNDAKIGVVNPTSFTIVRNSDGTNRNASGTNSGVATTFTAPVPISNMTSQIAQALWANGSISLATITGVVADDSKVAWALGRDAGSGTRLQTFQESGIGYNTPVVQFEPQGSGGVVTAHRRAMNPSSLLEDIKQLHLTPGDGGFNSGGTVATNLGLITSNALDKDGLPHTGAFDGPTGETKTGFYISYVGISDGTAALNNGAKELTWNGERYTIEGVREGRYTFWGYESLGYLSGISAAKKSVADALANRIIDVRAPDPKLNTMRCIRTSDGGVVLQNY